MNATRFGNKPSLASLLELQKQSTMREINCLQVGEIVSFNASNQTAEVKIKMTFLHNEKIEEYPILLDCPCVVLFGGKGRLTLPISAGDSCLVLFNDRDIDNWYSRGQSMPPRTGRKHSFSDAIALVGIHNKQNKITDYVADGTVLKYGSSVLTLKDGSVTITDGTAQVTIINGVVTVNAPTINLTGAVSVTGSFSVNGKDVGNTHKHTGVATGSGQTGGVV